MAKKKTESVPVIISMSQGKNRPVREINVTELMERLLDAVVRRNGGKYG